jgi:hypothetical protein
LFDITTADTLQGEEGARCNDFCFFGKKERKNIIALLSKDMKSNA